MMFPMTLADLFISVYAWLDANALQILAACTLLPLLGVLGAWVGRGGRTDQDGRLLANLVLGFGFVVFLLEVVGIAIAQWGFEKGLLEANLFLLLAPLAALAIGLFGIRLIFPLSELGSATTARDIGLFALALLVTFWLFSKFRGWGIIFFGNLLQMLVIGVLIFLLLRYLYRRAL